jgi:Zn-dependent peptidase ImmA (M78 family)
MSSEYCDESDEIQTSRPGIAGTDISRMEFQANYLAGCLLLPRSNLINDFRQLTQALAIPKKGHGALYVDRQPCNIENYHKVTAPLMQKYGTSRTAVSIRLDELGLLIDTRASTSFQTAHSAANFWGETHD